MSKEEILELIKEKLSITIFTGEDMRGSYVEVSLRLDGEEISSSKDHLLGIGDGSDGYE